MSITLDKRAAYDYIREANQTAQGVNPWNQLYGAVSANSLAQTQSKTADYSSLLSQAYAQSKNTTSAFEASPYGEGIKQYMIDENNAALKQAYESYKQNYLTDIASIQDTVDKQVAAIDTELDTQSDMYALTSDSVYDYYQALFATNPELFTGTAASRLAGTPNLSKYMKDGELMSKDELLKLHFDSDRNLTAAGTDFYDQMLNQQAVDGDGLSYDTWLRGQNTDKDSKYYGLADWMYSDSLYDWAPNAAGTKSTYMGTFKKMVGMSSDDEKYSFIERWGGLGKTDVNKLFERFANVNEKISKIDTDTANIKATTEAQEELDQYVVALKAYTKELGIYNDIDWNMFAFEHVKDRSELREQTKAKVREENRSASLGFGTMWKSLAPSITATRGRDKKAEAQKLVRNKQKYLSALTEITAYAEEKRQKSQS